MKTINQTIDADLWLEPEIKDTGRGIIFEMAVEHTKRSGTRVFTKLRVRFPRDSIGRVLHEVRKLHDKELATISEDVQTLIRKGTP